MAKLISIDRAIKYLSFFLFSLVVLGGGLRLSRHLLASPSATARWIGVALAVVSLVPWLVMVVLAVASLDEFQRHVVLVGTAFAFVSEGLFYAGFYAMLEARLIGPDVYAPHLVLSLLIWLGAVGIAALYYRIRT